MFSTTLIPLRERPAYQALADHYAKLQDAHLRELFAEDPGRGTRADRRGRRPVPGLLEEPRHRRDDRLLIAAGRRSRSCGAHRARCSAASKINITEDRAVLHVALRAPRDAAIVVDGEDVVPEVHAVLDRMARLRRAGAQRRSGRATPASASATSSTSASAAPTSAR